MSNTPITMEPISYSSGSPDHYRIIGLPEGKIAEIALKRSRGGKWVELWKIRLDGKGKFSGLYKSAEAALSVLLNRQASTTDPRN